ncbi:MAG: radical SAM family heme chaperone HemW [Syntrophobacterales bacterium]|nr:radical SAM family heme chaperone HemW [Syntrophobacterales bacterium]
MRSPGLYIHVPFCLSKCHYCGFYSTTQTSLIEGYLAALCREMDHYKNWVATFDTFYIGGGTPSVLSPRQIASLIRDARKNFSISEGAEITVETNPADTTDDLLQVLYESGVNRLSIGVQSFNDDLLAFLGRRHRAGQAKTAVKSAKEAGFENVSLDLIYGIPGQDIRGWEKTLQQAVWLHPEHLSCYQLTVEEGTPMACAMAKGEITLPDEQLQAEFFFCTAELLEKAGYLQYEVSNFALPGRESRHNQKYWNHNPSLGLGPSAHSFSGTERYWNHAAVRTYIEELTAGRLPVAQREALDPEKLRLEALFLGFRTRRGICLEEFCVRYGQDLLKEKKTAIDQLIAGGFVKLSRGFLKPTRQGLAVADSLALI